MPFITVRRATVGLALCGVAALAPVARGSDVRASDIAPTSTSSATSQGQDTLFQVSGQGFSSGGAVMIRLLDAGTNTVLFTAQAQASADSYTQDGTVYAQQPGRLFTTFDIGTPCTSPRVTVQMIDMATNQVSLAPVAFDKSGCDPSALVGSPTAGAYSTSDRATLTGPNITPGSNCPRPKEDRFAH